MSPEDKRGGGGVDSAPAPATRGRRRLLLVVAAVVVVIALVALAIALTSRSGSPKATGRSGAAASQSRITSAPPPLPTPTPTGPTSDVNQPPPTVAPVPLNSPASQSNGIVAALPKIESIQGTGVGPGNVSGPAVRVTVQIQNGTGAPVALGGVGVNLYYGADNTPAPPLDDPSARPFDGMLDPGKAATGVYVFSLPEDQRGKVTVEVGYQAGAPLLLFTGAVR